MFHEHGVSDCFIILCIFPTFPSDVNLYFFHHFKCLLVTSHALCFTLFASTLLRSSVFEFVLRRSFLRKN